MSLLNLYVYGIFLGSLAGCGGPAFDVAEPLTVADAGPGAVDAADPDGPRQPDAVADGRVDDLDAGAADVDRDAGARPDAPPDDPPPDTAAEAAPDACPVTAWPPDAGSCGPGCTACLPAGAPADPAVPCCANAVDPATCRCAGTP